MSDLIDAAADREELDRQQALKKHIARPAPLTQAGRGYCLNCFEDFDGDNTRLYCNGQCASAHEAKLSRKR